MNIKLWAILVVKTTYSYIFFCYTRDLYQPFLYHVFCDC